MEGLILFFSVASFLVSVSLAYHIFGVTPTVEKPRPPLVPRRRKEKIKPVVNDDEKAWLKEKEQASKGV